MNKITEIKNTIKNINSSLDESEERFNELKDRTFEIIQSEEQNEKGIKKTEERLPDYAIL